MIVVRKDIKFSKVIFYNTKFHPKLKMYCEPTDESYDPEVDKNGFYIYELPESDVRQKLKNRSDRWRLYGEDTKKMDVQLETPSGALKWKTFYPWVYETKSYMSGKHSNGEAIMKDKFIWKELVPKNPSEINETLEEVFPEPVEVVVEDKKKQY